jgi:hypothetical protein
MFKKCAIEGDIAPKVLFLSVNPCAFALMAEMEAAAA